MFCYENFVERNSTISEAIVKSGSPSEQYVERIIGEVSCIGTKNYSA